MSRSTIFFICLTASFFVFASSVHGQTSPIVAPPDECYAPPIGLAQYALCPSEWEGVQEFTYDHANSSSTVDADADETCGVPHEASADGLNLVYAIGQGGFAGWGVHWDNSQSGQYDISDKSALIFWLRGTTGRETFQVALRHKAGDDIAVQIGSIITALNTTAMEMVIIPLDQFAGLDKTSLVAMSIGFNPSHGSGSFCVDDFAFVSEYIVTAPAIINARGCAGTSCGIVKPLFPEDTILGVKENVAGETVNGNTDWVYAIDPANGGGLYIHSSLVSKLIPADPVIATFDAGNPGDVGVFYPDTEKDGKKNNVTESYEDGMVKVSYFLVDYGGYWMKLGGADWRKFASLTFDIRADAPLGSVKIELKRDENSEIGIFILENIGTSFSPVTIPLTAFDLSSLTNMSELVFVLEAHIAGEEGAIYLDNIILEP